MSKPAGCLNGDLESYPFLFGEKAQADAEVGTGLTG